MSHDAPEPAPHRLRAAIRRPRTVVAGTAAAVLLIVLLVLIFGGGGSAPRYSPAGGPTRVVAPAVSRLQVPKTPPFHPDISAVALADRLSPAQQVGQLFLVTVSGNTPAAAGSLAGTPWGGVVLQRGNFPGVSRLAALVGALRGALSRAAPSTPLMAAQQEGGPQSAFPGLPPKGQAALGASGNPHAAQAQAERAGRRLRALGIAMTLAPLADVDIPTGALSGRLFGSDPRLVTRFTHSEVAGYDSVDEIAAVGHFPGAGSASADPDQATATVGGSLAQLRARDLLPFAAVSYAAPVILMSNAAYTAFDGVTPASLLPQAVDLLRSELHFQGVVMSDDLEATLTPAGLSPAAAALQALKAGDDLLFISGPPRDQQAAYGALLAAVKHDPAVRRLVRLALLRVLTLKAHFGLLHPAAAAGRP